MEASCNVPKPITVATQVNGYPVHALLDTGSLGGFISSNLAQQLCLKTIELLLPINVQMAVQGSCTKVNHGTRVEFQYQEHQVSLCLEPPIVLIGSTLVLQPMTMYENKLDEVHQYLEDYTEKICKKAEDTPLPPLRDVNHEILLRDAYLASGCWELHPVKNMVPMLLLTKPGKEGKSAKLRMVKLSSPLPNIESILHQVA
ncbi:hypothetical protein P691DRAFT_793768 [Macrolepiota fuliginosa MF-IS2]|uniref:Uncharacterized protein n=1 Tax=Macrolepiota fuliginosa MF-IS2 TaxID=1400762 RepID=A0A9P5WWI1_9AGAR|nr:hypothetical protein P691DRAFT_793768 [Macrolepiota fuliginosa MF-IS2]